MALPVPADSVDLLVRQAPEAPQEPLVKVGPEEPVVSVAAVDLQELVDLPVPVARAELVVWVVRVASAVPVASQAPVVRVAAVARVVLQELRAPVAPAGLVERVVPVVLAEQVPAARAGPEDLPAEAAKAVTGIRRRMIPKMVRMEPMARRAATVLPEMRAPMAMRAKMDRPVRTVRRVPAERRPKPVVWVDQVRPELQAAPGS